MTDPVPYASPSPNASDLSHLQVLSILHYVCGGLAMLFSCFFIIYIVMGIWIATDRTGSQMMYPANVVVGPGGTVVARSPPPTIPINQAPPTWVGLIFAAMGSCGVLLGWALGILTIVSGRRLAQHRSRTFSMVVASINCVFFPFGTALGVFTIIVLAGDSVKSLYFDQSGRSML